MSYKQRPPQSTATGPLNPLSGCWVMDATRSQAPTAHLAALGLGDLAQAAGQKISSTVSLRITLRGNELSLAHFSSLGEKERRITLGEPWVETGRDGVTIRCVVELATPHQIRMNCDYGKARVVETKTLVAQDVMVQELTMTYMKGAVTQSTKTFIRVTQERQEELYLLIGKA